MSKGKSNSKKIESGKRKKAAADRKLPRQTLAEGFEPANLNLKMVLIQLFVLVFFTVVIYAQSLTNRFIFVDSYITGPFASKLREDNFWLELFLQAFTSPLSQSWLKNSFAQDIYQFGHDALSYRLVSLSLHILSCLCLYLLAFRITRLFPPRLDEQPPNNGLPYKVAFSSSLLFACHPMAIQSVAYIAGREGTLTGLNCLLALNLFLLGFWSNRAAPILIGYFGCFLCVVLAVATSPEGVAMPLLLLVTALLLHRGGPAKGVLSERRVELIVLSACAVAVPVISSRLPFSCVFGNNFGVPPLSQAAYLASQLQGFVSYYLRCAVLPVGLSIEPPYFVSFGFFNPGTIMGAAALVGIAFVSWLKRRSALISFALAIVVIGYLPSLMIVRSDYGSDERFYLPLAAICLIFGTVFARFAKARLHLTIIAGVAILSIFVALFFWRQSDWSSTLSLWSSAKRLDQTAHNRAMVTLFEVEGAQADQAKLEAEKLLEKNPDCHPALMALGKYEFLKGDYLAAKPYLTKALTLCDQLDMNEFTHYQTAVICLRDLVELRDCGTYSETISYLLKNYPQSDEVNFLAGKIALEHHNAMLAVRYLNKAFSIDRTNPDYVLALGQACLDSEDPTLIDNAYKTTRYISRRVPSPELRLIFGQAALEVGRPDECLSAMQKSIDVLNKLNYQITPEAKAKYYYLESLALHRLGKTSEAESAREAAVRLDPRVIDKVKIKMVDGNS